MNERFHNNTMVGRVQVDPGLEAVDPTLAFRSFQLLKQKYDGLLSKFGFNCNLRHYAMSNTLQSNRYVTTNVMWRARDKQLALEGEIHAREAAEEAQRAKERAKEKEAREQRAEKEREKERERDRERRRHGGAVQVEPGFAQLTPRLLSTLETKV